MISAKAIYGWVFGVLAMGGSGLAMAMSDEDAKALSADLLLIKLEVEIETCANLGARNMQKLYGAYRDLQDMRAELAPETTSASVISARSSYKEGLSALPKPELTEADHVAVLCDRTLEKMQAFTQESFTRMVASSARSYQQLFAQGK